jgi:hypothetical protein
MAVQGVSLLIHSTAARHESATTATLAAAALPTAGGPAAGRGTGLPTALGSGSHLNPVTAAVPGPGSGPGLDQIPVPVPELEGLSGPAYFHAASLVGAVHRPTGHQPKADLIPFGNHPFATSAFTQAHPHLDPFPGLDHEVIELTLVPGLEALLELNLDHLSLHFRRLTFLSQDRRQGERQQEDRCDHCLLLHGRLLVPFRSVIPKPFPSFPVPDLTPI